MRKLHLLQLLSCSCAGLAQGTSPNVSLLGLMLNVLQIGAIKAASLERQTQLDREAAELRQQQDDLTAKLKEFQQRVRCASTTCMS